MIEWILFYIRKYANPLKHVRSSKSQQNSKKGKYYNNCKYNENGKHKENLPSINRLPDTGWIWFNFRYFLLSGYCDKITATEEVFKL